MDLQSLAATLAGLSAMLSSLSATPAALPASAIVATTPSAFTVPSQNLALSLGALRESLVNIVCVSGDDIISSATGTGVIIDPRGLIMTVSHLGQYFLLQDKYPDTVECVVRVGNPARTAYVAEPVYVSPSWIKANPDTLTEENPKGTGEDDFAILAITGTATSTPLPETFPYVPLAPVSAQDPFLGQQVAIGAYGAQGLDIRQISQYLYPSLVFGSIEKRYTFSDAGTVDLVSVGGSAVAQEGSSGGGVVNDSGQLLGVITTSTTKGDLLSRDLHALTIGHVRRSFMEDTDKSLDSYLADTSIADLVKNFRKEDAALGKILTNDIRRAQ